MQNSSIIMMVRLEPWLFLSFLTLWWLFSSLFTGLSERLHHLASNDVTGGNNARWDDWSSDLQIDRSIYRFDVSWLSWYKHSVSLAQRHSGGWEGGSATSNWRKLFAAVFKAAFVRRVESRFLAILCRDEGSWWDRILDDDSCGHNENYINTFNEYFTNFLPWFKDFVI